MIIHAQAPSSGVEGAGHSCWQPCAVSAFSTATLSAALMSFAPQQSWAFDGPPAGFRTQPAGEVVSLSERSAKQVALVRQVVVYDAAARVGAIPVNNATSMRCSDEECQRCHSRTKLNIRAPEGSACILHDNMLECGAGKQRTYNSRAGGGYSELDTPSGGRSCP